MAYAIDNLTNSGIGKAELIVNGGKIVSTYRAIRQGLTMTESVPFIFSQELLKMSQVLTL